MLLQPHYGAEPILTLDGPPAAIAAPVIRQRRRLSAALAAFDDDQWALPSRCAGWSSRDVIVHLDSTNTFWSLAIAAGLRGEPTRFLSTFDPVASPAQMVAGANSMSSSEVLNRFVASTEVLADLLASLAEPDWSALAEAPPGHVSISAVAHHALWDSWVHERDVLLPLGIAPAEEADEVAACLRYAAALGPALALTRGAPGRGVLAVDATRPDLSFVVDVGDRVAVRDVTGDDTAAGLRLAGDAVDLLEAFSVRTTLQQQVPADRAWMLHGLAEQFDAPPA